MRPLLPASETRLFSEWWRLAVQPVYGEPAALAGKRRAARRALGQSTFHFTEYKADSRYGQLGVTSSTVTRVRLSAHGRPDHWTLSAFEASSPRGKESRSRD